MGSSPVQEPLTTSETKYVDFTIVLNYSFGPPPSGSVDWTATSISPDTATPNVDFQALSGTVNLDSGHMSEVVRIPIYYDVESESNETFRVTLSNPTGGNTIYAATAYGTIIDAPVNPMSVSITAQQEAITEGETKWFSIGRSSADGPLTVYFQVDASSNISAADYTLSPAGNSVTFANGQLEAFVDVTAEDDALLEIGELLVLELLTTAPGTQGPAQYLIGGSGEAGMSFHDGFHGYVNTPFTVEYRDEDGSWKPAPDNETLWENETLRWLPTIPPEVVGHVDNITWIKRPHDDPQASWVDFASGTVSEPAIGNPGLGYWDISFRMFYDVVSYFLAAPDDEAVNAISSTRWARGHDEQQFYYTELEDAGPYYGPRVFPETPHPFSGLTLNKVKVVVTLKMAPPPGKATSVSLKGFDPDHSYNPQAILESLDPNDDYTPGPPAVVDRVPNDNRQSTGTVSQAGVLPWGERLGGTLEAATLSFGTGETEKTTTFEIEDAQPANNFIMATAPLRAASSWRRNAGNRPYLDRRGRWGYLKVHVDECCKRFTATIPQ